MADHNEGTSQWLAKFILALWVILVVVLAFYLLSGRATARSAELNAAMSSVIAPTQTSSIELHRGE